MVSGSFVSFARYQAKTLNIVISVLMQHHQIKTYVISKFVPNMKVVFCLFIKASRSGWPTVYVRDPRHSWNGR